MNRPLWGGVAGVALLGIGGVAAIFVASSGGEEELVQQPSATPASSASPSATPGASVTQTPVSTSDAPPATPGPSPTPLPDGWEVYVDDERGFSFPHPPGLSRSQQIYDQTDNRGQRVGQVRTLSFRHPTGTPAISIAIALNPNNVGLEEWIRTFPGWPSEPRRVTIDGESALLFETNQMGQRYPGVYFRHGDAVVSISANVYGAAELGVTASPGISEADFQRVMDDFRFGS